MPHQLAIEGVAGHGNARVAEDALRAASSAAEARTDVHQREVAGAAAEVGDQKQLVLLEAALVVVGRADRLVLEDDLAKAGVGAGGAQPPEGEGLVGGVLGVDEAHRAPHHGALHRLAELPLRLLAQRAQHDGHQILEAPGAAEHLGGAEQPTGEE
jgi:hypothetical protein